MTTVPCQQGIYVDDYFKQAMMFSGHFDEFFCGFGTTKIYVFVMDSKG
jgi:hypothetical protein